ncbi:hypothetical protein CP532_0467 [Ophiocordyceps camponoti-leonardi (nom. inval.)]|nr:hypothetical protein CP532_0467 [Ophiocordyceps camponoti-leonardi (nom. inval.)]
MSSPADPTTPGQGPDPSPPPSSPNKAAAAAATFRPFRLLKQDALNIRSRWPSDWKVMNQQVLASAVYIFFTNLLPGITFASDLYELTGRSWGPIEVVFSTGLCGLIFSIVIYFHKAALELKRTHGAVSLAAFLYAVIGAFGTCLVAVLLSTAESWRPLLHRYLRLGLAEYAAAISIVLWIGIPHIGELDRLDHQRLQVQTQFRPSDPDRTVFLVPFWRLSVSWIFLSIIPAAIVTVLFFFDHEISSIICTSSRYGVRKPGGFAWDVALLGLTTLLCGLLGLPPANGLLPQAPLHSESLLYRPDGSGDDDDDDQGQQRRRTYEQRYSALIQASLILAFISPPLQRLLGLTQTSVLAGLFMFMGYQSLAVNPILYRVAHLLTPPSDLPALPRAVSWLAVHGFTLTQITLTAAVFAMTLTVAAPAFPLVIVALVPVRLTLMGRIWSRETLRFVDGWACRPGKPEDQRAPPQRPQDEEKGNNKGM